MLIPICWLEMIWNWFIIVIWLMNHSNVAGWDLFCLNTKIVKLRYSEDSFIWASIIWTPLYFRFRVFLFHHKILYCFGTWFRYGKWLTSDDIEPLQKFLDRNERLEQHHNSCNALQYHLSLLVRFVFDNWIHAVEKSNQRNPLQPPEENLHSHGSCWQNPLMPDLRRA